MQIVPLRDGTGVVQWSPTTALICSACREHLQVSREGLQRVNFVFDLQDRDGLKRGEYWYIHKQCARVEDALCVSWGWYSMRYVLGKDGCLKKYYGDLRKSLRKIMPHGVYEELYAAWLPAINAGKTKQVLRVHRQVRLAPPSVHRDPSPHIPKAGAVYILQAEGTPRVKIGRSVSVAYRFQSLHTASPFPLRLLRSIPTADCVALERSLHQRYAAYRQHREWFDLPSDVLQQLLSEDFASCARVEGRQ